MCSYVCVRYHTYIHTYIHTGAVSRGTRGLYFGGRFDAVDVAAYIQNPGRAGICVCDFVYAHMCLCMQVHALVYAHVRLWSCYIRL